MSAPSGSAEAGGGGGKGNQHPATPSAPAPQPRAPSAKGGGGGGGPPAGSAAAPAASAATPASSPRKNNRRRRRPKDRDRDKSKAPATAAAAAAAAGGGGDGDGGGDGGGGGGAPAPAGEQGGARRSGNTRNSSGRNRKGRSKEGGRHSSSKQGGGANGTAAATAGAGRPRGQDRGGKRGSGSGGGGGGGRHSGPSWPDDQRAVQVRNHLRVFANPDSTFNKRLQASNSLQSSLLHLGNLEIVLQIADNVAAQLVNLILARESSIRLHAARCLGALGATLGPRLALFPVWVQQRLADTTVEDHLPTCLALSTALEYDRGGMLHTTMGSILLSLRTFLESTYCLDYLSPVMDVLQLVGKKYPQFFASVFQDLLDVLIGWMVAPGVPSYVCDNLADATKTLQPFWLGQLPFTASLVSNLLDDGFAHVAQHQPGSGDVQAAPADGAMGPKLVGLTRCVAAIINAIGLHFTYALGAPMSPPWIHAEFARFVALLTHVQDQSASNRWRKQIGACLEVFVGCLLVNAAGPSCAALGFLLSQLQHYKSSDDIVCWLHTVRQMCLCLGEQIPLASLQRLLGPDSSLHELRQHKFESVSEALAALYDGFLNLRAFQLVEVVHASLQRDLAAADRRLASHQHSSATGDQGAGQAEPGASRDFAATDMPNSAVNSIVFDCAVYTRMAEVAKRSLSLRMLSPPIVEVLASQPHALAPAAIEEQPRAAYAILQAINACATSDGLFSGEVPPVAQLLALLWDVILRVLSARVIPIEHCLLCLGMVRRACKSGARAWFPVPTRFLELCDQILVSQRSDHRIATMYTLHDMVCTSGCIRQSDLRRVVMTLRMSLGDFRIAVRRRALLTLSSLPYSQLMGSPSQRLMKSLRVIQGTAPLALFQAEHFKVTVQSLVSVLQGFRERLTYDSDSLRAMWQSVTTSPLAGLEALELSAEATRFWVLSEAAKFMVSNRLRTPLGRPAQSFEAIEKSLRQAANIAQTTPAVDARRLESAAPVLGKAETEKRAVLDLLMFIIQLDKYLFNAYDGSVCMPAPSKNSRAFFRANRKVCEDWLTRVQTPLMVTASTSGVPSAAIASGMARVQHLLSAMKRLPATELLKPCIQFERTLLVVTTALINIAAPTILAGLLAWMRKAAPRNLCAALGLKDRSDWVPWLGPAMLEAEDKLEEAHKKYDGILNKVMELPGAREAEVPFDASIAEFLVTRSLSCKLALRDSEAASNFLASLAAFRDGLGNAKLVRALTPRAEMSEPYIKALGLLHDGRRDDALAAFKDVAMLDVGNWNMEYRVHAVDQGCLSAMLVWDVDPAKASQQLQHASAVLESCILDQPREMHNFLSPLIVRNQAIGLLQALQQSPPQLSVLRAFDYSNLSVRDLHVSSLTTVFDTLQHAAGAVVQAEDRALVGTALEIVRLQLCRVARKASNLGLVRRVLGATAQQTSFHLYERAKLAHSSGETKAAILGLSELVLAPPAAGATEDAIAARLAKHSVRARALLRLAQWLPGEDAASSAEVCARLLPGVIEAGRRGDTAVQEAAGPAVPTDAGSALALGVGLTRALALGAEGGATAAGANPDQSRFPEALTHDSFNTDLDLLIGRLLHLATVEAPQYAKARITYAAWCYRQGRRTVDKTLDTSGRLELSDAEREHLRRVLEQHGAAGPTSRMERLVDVLSTTHLGGDTVPGLEEVDDTDPQHREEAVRRCVQALVPDEPAALVDGVMRVWSEVNRRLMQLYRLAADAYFTFLRVDDRVVVALDPDQQSDSEDNHVTATLRLLRLLVKHGPELQGAFSPGFASTPTHPWQRIIPQLFSRLSHPSQYVKDRVLELLCKIAESTPHLIVYPAVVGVQTLGGDAEAHDEDARQQLRAFQRITATLSARNPGLVQGLEAMILELKRITVLWEERWLDALHQRQSDVSRRLQRLAEEASRVEENRNLDAQEKRRVMGEKHAAIMRPVLVAFERTKKLTYAMPAETVHEEWFRDTYGRPIDSALHELQAPSCEPYNPDAVWAPLKQIFEELKSQSTKRSSLSLRLGDLSPELARTAASAIAMPGHAISPGEELVTIQSFQDAVTVLPTKTKPKKLTLVGSDGKPYSYLFKGMEDLHLDERIMQFLEVVNVTLRKKTVRSQDLLRARHYNVIPLGVRSALIQWVAGAVPLFTLYKRWQQRQYDADRLAAQQLEAQSQVPQPSTGASASASSGAGKVKAPLRPSELFYSKLTPALQSRGLTTLTARSKWPLDVLRAVLHQLQSETPQDLVSRELWLESTSPADLLAKTNRFAGSLAVMSMIGYVIGLGDRHLDNLLVDFRSGEIVHIDYNVCFEKGVKLRVPETVPFRLTQSLRHALGVTGVDGHFRKTSETVLRQLRTSRETLLTLLEAFIYDPLVDWTPNMKSEAEKEAMEKGISYSLLAARITELKVPLQTNRERHRSALPQFQDHLETLMGAIRSKTSLEEQMAKWAVEAQLLGQAAAQRPDRVLAALAGVYREAQTHRGMQEGCIAAIRRRSQELSQWHEHHALALEALRGAQLDKLRADVLADDGEHRAAVNTLAVATAFLQSVGLSTIIEQGYATHAELAELAHRRRTAMLACLDLLHSYRTIVTEYPRGTVRQSYCHRWREWLDQVAAAPNAEACRAAVQEAAALPPHPGRVALCVRFEGVVRRHLDGLVAQATQLRESTALATAGDPERLQGDVRGALDAVRAFVARAPDSRGAAVLESATVRLLYDLAVLLEGQEEAALQGTGDRPFAEVCTTGDLVGRLLGLLRETYQASSAGADPSPGATAPALTCGGFEQEGYIVSLRPFSCAQTVLQALQDLPGKILSGLVPDAVRVHVAGDASLEPLVGDLGRLIADLGGRLSLADGRERLSALLTRLPAGSASTTEGQRLLCTANALFEGLEQDFARLAAACAPRFPFSFAGVAPGLPRGHSDDGTLRPLLVERLRVMRDTARACVAYANAFVRDYQAPRPPGDDAGAQGAEQAAGGELGAVLRARSPAAAYCLRFFRARLGPAFSSVVRCVIGSRLQVLGLSPSAEAAELWAGDGQAPTLKALVDRALLQPALPPATQTVRLLQLLQAYAEEQRRLDAMLRAQAHAAVADRAVGWCRLQLARFQWLRHEALARSAEAAAPLTPTLESVVGEILQNTQRLGGVQKALREANERFAGLERNVAQRLTWACGANRALGATLARFNAAAAERREAIAVDAKTSDVVVGVGNALVHFETYRTLRLAETQRLNTSNQALVRAYAEALGRLEAVLAKAQRLEEELPAGLKEFAPQGIISAGWIQARLLELPAVAASAASELQRLLAALPTQQAQLRGDLAALRDLAADTNGLMHELAPLLVPLEKGGDGAARLAQQTFRSHEALAATLFDVVDFATTKSTNFPACLDADAAAAAPGGHVVPSAATGALAGAGQAPGAGIPAPVASLATALLDGDLSGIQRLGAGLEQIFEQLLSLETYQESTYELDQHGPAATASDREDPVDRPTAAASKTGGGKSTRGRQDRNAHAVGVWKRVRMKLEGRDSDNPNGKRRPIAEQVDSTIRDAISSDNLCRLYEGWTPWI